jgi:hypothetical protein
MYNILYYHGPPKLIAQVVLNRRELREVLIPKIIPGLSRDSNSGPSDY